MIFCRRCIHYFSHFFLFDVSAEAAVHEAGRVTGGAAHATWSAVSATLVLTLAAILC